jgi:hypothetical protein
MNWKHYLAGLGALLFAASAAAQTNFTPLFQFGIFYNSLLEFTWCAPLTVNGRTHANASIYTGSIDPLTFNGLVTTTGTISSPAWDGHPTSDYTASVTYNAGYSTNTEALALSFGTTNYASILSQSTNSSSLYYNAASLVLLVSNSTVTLTLQSSSADPYPTNITAVYFPTNINSTNYVQVAANFPFLNLTNAFTDQREAGKLVKVTDIDVGILGKWLLTNKTAATKFPNTNSLYGINNVPNILYAADDRTNTPSQLMAIRLKNGSTIPTNMVPLIISSQYTGVNLPSGFTVATPNPLYVEGNYNCPNVTALNTTNTTATFPASLVSDALTILSAAWVDLNSNETLGSSGGGIRTAVSTTVNAAILTGNVPSTGSAGSQYSGGVMNLPRLLEDWGNGGSVTLTLNTSLVNLFASTRATNHYQTPGVYYYAPTRQFSFNQNFLNSYQLPPGTPLLLSGLIITIQPQSQTVCAGQTAVFSVGATSCGPPLAYQWLSGSYNCGVAIPNATKSTLTITNASAGNVGSYYVVVTNLFGSQTSSNALLTVGYPPVINEQPVSQSVLAGNGVTFSVSAGGTAPLSYQWYYDQTNALAGATGASLVLSNVQSTAAGSYSVSVSNACGSVNSEAASLTVNIPPAISLLPQNLAVLAGQDATFTVSATGTEPLFYQWQCNGTNLVEGTDATLLLPNVTADHAGGYAVTVSNLAGTATSAPAMLSVYNTAGAALAVLPPPAGGPFQFSISGVPGFNYAIEASTNLVDWMPLATNISPFTFVDGDATNFPARYYRSVYLP